MTPHAPIVGADRLTGHFGGWPSFHDAEVVRLVLDRHGTDGPTAELVVHVWSVGAEVDPDGRFPRREHALVRLLLERIADEREPVVRGAALWALGGLDPARGRALADRLRTADPDADVRAEAVALLEDAPTATRGK